jgi:hypothetical protein
LEHFPVTQHAPRTGVTTSGLKCPYPLFGRRAFWTRWGTTPLDWEPRRLALRA